MNRMKKFICIFLCVILLIGGYALGVNFYILAASKKHIIETNDVSDLSDLDCVLVLGCGVKEDGTPSDMLKERVQKGVEVFNESNAEYLLLSGDKSGETYDEPKAMKELAISLGVSQDQIKIDSIGYSTYESIYNAKKIYGVEKMIIITQSYHLPRALFIAKMFNIDSYGVTAYLTLYPRQIIWSLREVAARNKDFLKCIFSK